MTYAFLIAVAKEKEIIMKPLGCLGRIIGLILAAIGVALLKGVMAEFFMGYTNIPQLLGGLVLLVIGVFILSLVRAPAKA
jgi:hypothetical protein